VREAVERQEPIYQAQEASPERDPSVRRGLPRRLLWCLVLAAVVGTVVGVVVGVISNAGFGATMAMAAAVVTGVLTLLVLGEREDGTVEARRRGRRAR
jgi:hypothetical protein